MIWRQLSWKSKRQPRAILSSTSGSSPSLSHLWERRHQLSWVNRTVVLTGSKRLLNFIDGRMKTGQVFWKVALRQTSVAHPRSAHPNGQHTTSLLFLVHVSPNIRRGPGDGRGVSEPAEAADWHLPSRQRWRLPCQPGRALGTRHWHPESSAAGSKPKRCVHCKDRWM